MLELLRRNHFLLARRLTFVAAATCAVVLVVSVLSSGAAHHGPLPPAAMRHAPALPRTVVARDAHSITLDVHRIQVVSALVHRSRGAIGGYEIRLSADGRTWGEPVASGSQADTPRTLSFSPRAARFVRLVATSGDLPDTEFDVLGGGPVAAVNPAVAGSWGKVIGFPLVPVASVTLPGNRLLAWSAYLPGDHGDEQGYTETAVLDLTTGAVSSRKVVETGHDMFCPGTAMLGDGRLMVTGGSNSAKTSIYTPATNTWQPGPDLRIPRGYQGMTPLATGGAFVLGGSWSGAVGGKQGEVWSPNGGWRVLPGVPVEPTLTDDPGGVWRSDNHGWYLAVAGGRVFHAGPSRKMHWISTDGDGSVTDAGTRGEDAMNGNAVLYDVGKILTVGGATAYEEVSASKRAYTVDVKGAKPVTKRVGDMANARAFANSVVLPDGKVLVVGGQSFAVPFSDEKSVLVPELWDPANGKFTPMAPMAVPRNYHSVANLLPDGRVFSGGGGLCGECATNHFDGQIFSPPYLLKADGTPRARPVIVSAPPATAPGAKITVRTEKAVKAFSLVRTGASTHSVNNDQRRVPLPITSTSGTTYTLTVPADRGVALPGTYLLFALDSAGTPGVASTIQIG
ncbi:galactose oxidase-like domain-containing protein [Lentzea tibetensis]|uniref:galactose oxidase-like domain-containing protein n=1 Tax=Lentzea tibetensis TaxID=2591470 RepID=UPI001C9A2362|nr:galactose oxidase-like domain-containing protein [Lentzea tibetensis]